MTGTFEPQLNAVSAMTKAYFAELDSRLDEACHHEEHLTSRLPSWMLTNRRITIAYAPRGNFFTIRAIPDETIESDVFDTMLIMEQRDFQAATSPIPLRLHLPLMNSGFWAGDPKLEQQGNPTAPPIYLARGAVGVVSNDGMLGQFLSLDKARETAAGEWARAHFELPPGSSVYEAMQNTFYRFAALIRRKAFKERRIHRFLNEHRNIMLPAHRRCLYEHAVHLGDEIRVADFILEREFGLPPLLVELETPAAPVFKKNGELTYEANHAREQIREWVQFIDNEPSNRMGDTAFLAGPKLRLVIQGQGLEFIDKMEASKYSDTTIWTYDMLLREAKQRCHEILVDMHTRLGRDAAEIPPFK